MSGVIRVLHVDDEPIIGDVTRRSLEKDGKFRVDYVNSAEEAFDKIRDNTYSCIISDYEMPSMNGLDLLKKVRSVDPDIPFILLSGKGRELVFIDAINNGADFYVHKDGDARSLFAELNHKVEYAIQKRNAFIAIRRRDSILEAISLVANLILCGDSFESALREAITLFGLSTEVDEVSILKSDFCHDNNPSFSEFVTWKRLNNDGSHSDENNILKYSDIGDFEYRRLLKGEPVFYTEKSPNQIAAHSSFKNMRSMAIFPIFAERKMWGLIWFVDCLSDRIWPDIEVDALLTASAIIGSAVQHHTLQSKLIDTQKNFERLYHRITKFCDTIPDMLWIEDPYGDPLYLNHQAKRDKIFFDAVKNSIQTSFLEKTCFEESSMSTLAQPFRGDLKHIGSEKEYIFDLIQIPIQEKSGQFSGTVSIARDISSERMIQRNHLLNQRRFDLILDRYHQGIIFIRFDGMVTAINKNAKKLIGLEDNVDIKTISHNSIPLLKFSEKISSFFKDEYYPGKILVSDTIEFAGRQSIQCDYHPLYFEEEGYYEILVILMEISSDNQKSE